MGVEMDRGIECDEVLAVSHAFDDLARLRAQHDNMAQALFGISLALDALIVQWQ